MANLVNQAIPATILADALKSVQDARAVLAPFLTPLTPEQRTDLPKMGDKSLAFVTKAADYAQSLSRLMPQYLDVKGLETDAAVSADLLPLFQELLGLTTDVESTRMQAGSEGYTASLVAYGALKTAAHQNQPGAQAAVAELETRFAGQRKRKGKDA